MKSLLLSATIIFGSSFAFANPTTYTLSQASNFTSLDGTVNITYNGITENVYVGPLSVDVKNNSTGAIFQQYVYCVDILDNFQNNATYTVTTTDLSSRLGSLAALQIAAIVENTLQSTDYAAIQAAIWKFGYPTITYNNPNPNFIPDMNYYVSQVTSGAWVSNSAYLIQEYLPNPLHSSQDLIFVTKASEPNSFGIFALGLGMIGISCYRKRVV